MKLNEIIADHYGPMTAKSYDGIASRLFWAYDETLTAMAVELFYGRRTAIDQVPRIESVLDIGIGTGNLSEKIIQERNRAWRLTDETNPPAPLKLVGMDGSSFMMERAREKISVHPEVRFESRICTLKQLPQEFEGQKFDAIVSSFAIHHLNGEGKARLFSALSRMLNPGGTLVIGDRMPPLENQSALQNDFHAVVAQKILNVFDNADGEALALSTVMAALDQGFQADGDQPSSIEEHQNFLTRAGFQAVRCPFHSFGCAVVSGISRAPTAQES